MAACLGQNCGVPTPSAQDEQVAGFHPDNPTTQPSGNDPIAPAAVTLNADAGEDLVVDEGTVVTVDGSASTGSAATVYRWTQVFGPPVSWQTLSQSEIQFTAPQVSGDTELVFMLTLTEGSASVSDSVAVLVKNVAPVIPANVELAVSPPIAEGEAPLSVVYSVTTVDSQVLAQAEGKYVWTFDDGSTSEGEEVTRVFSKPGIYLTSVCLFMGPALATQVGCSQSTAVVPYSKPTLNVVMALAGDSALVTMACESQPASDVQIRYTTDGSIPTENSEPYLGTITLNKSAQVTARVFPAAADADERIASSPSTVSVTVTSQVVTPPVTPPVAPGRLAITMPDAIACSGNQGGTFGPADKTQVVYVLSNSGGSAITWSATPNVAWLTLSSSNGFLDPGGIITEQVTVSVNQTEAAKLPAGSHTGTVTFANTTNGNGNDTRMAYLTVNAVTPTVVAPVIAAIANGSATAGAAYTGPTPTLTQGTTPVTWSLVTGPADMAINTSTGVVSWSTPTTTGSPFTVKIRATNSAGYGEKSWTLTVNAAPTNTAPAVSAGPNKYVVLPNNSVALAGTITDDGKPNPPAAVTATWSKVSGPGTVTFANAGAASTTATFGAAGTYVLQLTGNDGALTTSSTVTVYVIPVLTIQASATSGPAPLDVTFTAKEGTGQATTIPTGGTFTWNYGDGSAAETGPLSTHAQRTHRYASAGTFTATLTLTLPNSLGTVSCGTVAVTISASGTGLTPIARWDTVPYQRINAGETLNVGVVAFSKAGIQKVRFTINGQGYKGVSPIDVTSMTLNPQTGVWEYWTPIRANDFASDGTFTVAVSVTGNDGGARSLDTYNFTANPTGTLRAPAAYVNATTGNDATGAVNDASRPYQHIKVAVRAITNWSHSQGGDYDAGGGTVYLAPGTHSHAPTTDWDTLTCANEWVTITGDTAENTIVTTHNACPNVTKLHLKNLTLQWDGIGSRIIQYSSSADYLSSVWYDNCATVGAGRMATNSFPVALADLSTQYWTDCVISQADFAIQGATVLARGLTVRDIGEDAFRNTKCIVNCTVDNNSNAYIPKLVGATYTNTEHASGYNYVIEQAGAFASYTFVAGDRFFIESGGTYGPSYVYNVAAKISNDAIRLTSTAGSSGPVTGWLTNVKHSDVWQWIYYTGKTNEDNIIVYGLKATNVVGQGISNNSLVANVAAQAINVAFVNVYIESSDQNYWQRWTDHLLLWNCTFSRLFYFAPDYSLNPLVYAWSSVTNLSMKGCCFAGGFGDSYTSHPECGAVDYTSTTANHFRSGTTKGSAFTSGDPGLDSHGVPETGSILLRKMTSLVPVDIANVVRPTTEATIGAYEPPSPPP